MTGSQVTLTIVVDNDEASRTVFELEQGEVLSFGRFKQNDVVLEHPGISNKHLELKVVQISDCNSPAVTIKDLSSNGTGLQASSSTSAVMLVKGHETPVHDGSIVLLPMTLKVKKDEESSKHRRCFSVRIGTAEKSQPLVQDERQAELAQAQVATAASEAHATQDVDKDAHESIGQAEERTKKRDRKSREEGSEERRERKRAKKERKEKNGEAGEQHKIEQNDEVQACIEEHSRISDGKLDTPNGELQSETLPDQPQSAAQDPVGSAADDVEDQDRQERRRARKERKERERAEREALQREEGNHEKQTHLECDAEKHADPKRNENETQEHRDSLQHEQAREERKREKKLKKEKEDRERLERERNDVLEREQIEREEREERERKEREEQERREREDAERRARKREERKRREEEELRERERREIEETRQREEQEARERERKEREEEQRRLEQEAHERERRERERKRREEQETRERERRERDERKRREEQEAEEHARRERDERKRREEQEAEEHARRERDERKRREEQEAEERARRERDERKRRDEQEAEERELREKARKHREEKEEEQAREREHREAAERKRDEQEEAQMLERREVEEHQRREQEEAQEREYRDREEQARQRDSSEEVVREPSDEPPPWAKVGHKLQWWSESQQKLFPVRVSKVDERHKVVIATFEENPEVWKSVPFKFLGQRGCPLRPYPEDLRRLQRAGSSKGRSKREQSRSATPEWWQMQHQQKSIEEVMAEQQREQTEREEQERKEQEKARDEKRRRELQEAEQLKVREAFEKRKREAEERQLKEEEEWRQGLRRQREEEAALEATLLQTLPPEPDSDEEEEEERRRRKQKKEERKREKRKREEEEARERKEAENERKRKEAEDAFERQCNDAKMLIRQRALQQKDEKPPSATPGDGWNAWGTGAPGQQDNGMDWSGHGGLRQAWPVAGGGTGVAAPSQVAPSWNPRIAQTPARPPDVAWGHGVRPSMGATWQGTERLQQWPRTGSDSFEAPAAFKHGIVQRPSMAPSRDSSPIGAAVRVPPRVIGQPNWPGHGENGAYAPQNRFPATVPPSGSALATRPKGGSYAVHSDQSYRGRW